MESCLHVTIARESFEQAPSTMRSHGVLGSSLAKGSGDDRLLFAVSSQTKRLDAARERGPSDAELARRMRNDPR